MSSTVCASSKIVHHFNFFFFFFPSRRPLIRMLSTFSQKHTQAHFQFSPVGLFVITFDGLFVSCTPSSACFSSNRIQHGGIKSYFHHDGVSFNRVLTCPIVSCMTWLLDRLQCRNAQKKKRPNGGNFPSIDHNQNEQAMTFNRDNKISALSIAQSFDGKINENQLNQINKTRGIGFWLSSESFIFGRAAHSQRATKRNETSGMRSAKWSRETLCEKQRRRKTHPNHFENHAFY